MPRIFLYHLHFSTVSSRNVLHRKSLSPSSDKGTILSCDPGTICHTNLSKWRLSKNSCMFDMIKLNRLHSLYSIPDVTELTVGSTFSKCFCPWQGVLALSYQTSSGYQQTITHSDCHKRCQGTCRLLSSWLALWFLCSLCLSPATVTPSF